MLQRNELNNHLPLSGFIHQTTSGVLPTRVGAICLLLHKQLGAISRLRYLSESETFIIPSCQGALFLLNPSMQTGVAAFCSGGKKKEIKKERKTSYLASHVTTFHLEETAAAARSHLTNTAV